jgi:signal transduction histidine kinase
MLESEKICQSELIALKKEYEEFVYIISHDMKTPMRAISNIAAWIEEDLGTDLNKGIQDNFSLLKNRVVRLENMMNALLDLSRVDRYEMGVYEINIPKLINDCIELTKNRSNVEFHVSLSLINESWTTIGKKLEKVLLSLLDNAVRFHDKEKKNVFIEVIENETHYEIKVTDDGPGIPEEVKDKIFNIFYTVNSKDFVDSTGAGLAISYKIIKIVGGSIEYSPGLHNGSVFKFSWPKLISK